LHNSYAKIVMIGFPGTPRAHTFDNGWASRCTWQSSLPGPSLDVLLYQNW